MISLEEARTKVLRSIKVAQPVNLPIREALGCVVARPIEAEESVPPFDNTSMDGYALRSSDTRGAPVQLRVVGELPAGRAPELPVGKGEAIRIMTGAPIPSGADAIVPVEQTDPGPDGTVVVQNEVPPRTSLRFAGEDVKRGDIVLVPGTELRPAHLGLLSGIGVLEVGVYPRLRIGVLSSGDELVTDGTKLAPGQIRESNKELLLGLVQRANAIPIDLGLARDNEDSITSAFLRAAAECDALITSGGVSMGDYDLVKVVLEKVGRMEFMQINIQPAKPFAFGALERPEHGETVVFGLPGNPVSSFVSFELLARPALRKMMGHADLDRPSVVAIADEGLPRRSGDGRVQWQRVNAHFEHDGRVHVQTTGPQGSHQLAATAAANALARVDPGSGVLPGEEVHVLLLEA